MGQAAGRVGTLPAVMEPKLVRVGVLGCGNVGAAFVQLVAQQADSIAARTGLRLEITRVAVRNLARERDVELPDGILTRDAHALVEDPDVDLVVEVIGGIEPARELIRTAIEHHKPVFTANKELLANVGAAFVQLVAQQADSIAARTGLRLVMRRETYDDLLACDLG